MRAELLDGRHALEDLLGHPVTGYASAYGEHTAATMEAMREAGFAYARPTTVTRAFQSLEDPIRWQASTHHQHDSVALARAFLAQTPPHALDRNQRSQQSNEEVFHGG